MNQREKVILLWLVTLGVALVLALVLPWLFGGR